MPSHIWGSYYSSVTATGATTDVMTQSIPGWLTTLGAVGGAAGATYFCGAPATLYNAGTIVYHSWNNYLSAANIVSDSRPISLGIRMSLRYPAATTPPILMAGRMPNNTFLDTDISGTSGNTLFSSAITTKGGSNCTSMQANWVPRDAVEFSTFGFYNAGSSATTNPFVAMTGKVAADVCQLVIEVIQFFLIQANTTAQTQYYFNSPQPDYTPVELWNAYIKLTSNGKGAVAVVENFVGSGHSHGESHGLNSSSSDARTTSVNLTQDTVVNPMPENDGAIGSGVLQVGGSTALSKMGALGIGAIGAYLNLNANLAHGVGPARYDIENPEAHFAPPAALVLTNEQKHEQHARLEAIKEPIDLAQANDMRDKAMSFYAKQDIITHEDEKKRRDTATSHGKFKDPRNILPGVPTPSIAVLTSSPQEFDSDSELGEVVDDSNMSSSTANLVQTIHDLVIGRKAK
jgi:hypothetical protein